MLGRWSDESNVMALLELIIPGLGKRNMRRGIHNLYVLARAESLRQELPRNRDILWEALTGSASGLLQQLLVQNVHPSLDWGLKKHRRRVGMQDLMHIYYWMILYVLLLFRENGLEGYSANDEFRALVGSSQAYAKQLRSWWNAMLRKPMVILEPWDERWESQSSEEAAMGLHDSIMGLLGISYGSFDTLKHAVGLNVAANDAWDGLQTIVVKRIDAETT